VGVRSAKGSAKRSSQSVALTGAGASSSTAGPGSGQRHGSAQGSGTAKKRSKSTTASFIELAAIIGIAVLLALGIQAFIVKPYRIPSRSMEPTLTVGQRVLVNRIGTDFSGPHVGEVAVFHPPEGAENEQCGASRSTPIDFGGAACDQTNPREETGVNFIKRVVAGPGDTISIREGHVYRNGKPEPDSYIRACGGVQECNFPNPIKIPAGHWFMMGDNRGESDDSRFWGPVPTSWIIGEAFATYWPPDRIGSL
jgi:signal peptidase I